MSNSKKLKILITSGGTRVKIDQVRYITNMSRGTFGSQICNAFAKNPDNDIMFFHAKNSKLPTLSSNVKLVEFDLFADYYGGIKRLLEENKFDIIVLAAAVSDYGVDNFFDGKYHSEENMSIYLFPLPKVIDHVRKMAPDSFICGFKLLVNSTEDELKAAMEKQFADHHINMCVGNDLRDIKADNHKLTIMFDGNPECEHYEKPKGQGGNLAEIVAERCRQSLCNWKLSQLGQDLNSIKKLI